MSEDTYPKEAIKVYHEGIEERLKKIDTKLGAQNGRIGKLEQWQSFLMGGMAIITVLFVPMIFIFLNNFLGM